jgi:hypothetical protein
MYLRKINGKTFIPRNQPNGYWDEEMENLYNMTYTKYFFTVWNTTPTKNADGLRILARNLDRNGNMDTWNFATQIHKKLHDLQKKGIWKYSS